MMNGLLTRPQTAIGQRARPLIGYGLALGLAATMFVPADLSAAAFSLGVAGQSRSAAPVLLRDDLLPAHCCHSHPYSPYDNYCCHESAGYRAGRAAVGGAVAYGTYRGVKSATKKHYKSHDKRRYKSRRR